MQPSTIKPEARRLVDQLVSLPAQTADDEFAIEHVHLAADGFDEEFFGHGFPFNQAVR